VLNSYSALIGFTTPPLLLVLHCRFQQAQTAYQTPTAAPGAYERAPSTSRLLCTLTAARPTRDWARAICTARSRRRCLGFKLRRNVRGAKSLHPGLHPPLRAHEMFIKMVNPARPSAEVPLEALVPSSPHRGPGPQLPCTSASAKLKTP